MKILQVIPFFSPRFGGSVKSTFSTCQKLAERGHSITILTTDYQFDSSYAQQLKNVEIIPIKCSIQVGLFLYSPDIKTWLSQNLQKFDIIHMQTYRSYQNAIIHDYAQKFNIPYILQARGSVLPFFEKKGLKICFDTIWGKKILRNASCCIALSKTELFEYSKMGISINKIKIIPNGVETSEYIDLPSQGKFKNKYHIHETDQIILSLGRIHKIKGIDLLLKSFSQFCHEKTNVKLVIAGPDGGDLSRIKKLVKELKISKNVVFVGPLYGKDKLEAFCDSVVFILPSIYEVFGNTIIESMACGTPVITTTGCHITDIVRQAGIVVDFDADQLKDAIISIITDEKLAKQMGRQGRELVFSQFDQEIIIDKILQEYYSAIGT